MTKMTGTTRRHTVPHGRVWSVRSAAAAGAAATVAPAALLAAALLGVGAPAVALAHADYRSSTPADGSVVPAPPARVTAAFSEDVRPAGSSLVVYGPDGARADAGDGRVDTSTASRTTMVVTLRSGLGTGTYTVDWVTVSADDGDRAAGRFSFSIGAPSAVTGLPRTGGAPADGPAPLAAAAGGVGLLLAGYGATRAGRRGGAAPVEQ
jgi:methionine-rich copper-binding protein CopC